MTGQGLNYEETTSLGRMWPHEGLLGLGYERLSEAVVRSTVFIKLNSICLMIKGESEKELAFWIQEDFKTN